MGIIKVGFACLVIVAVATPAAATDVRAAKSGLWGAPDTWLPSGVPGAGDRIIGLGAHEVRIEDAAEIGAGSAEVALAIDGAGRLILGEGAKLRVNGHVNLMAQAAELVIEADAQLLFNPPAGQVYELQLNQSGQKITFAGRRNARGLIGLAPLAQGHYHVATVGFKDSVVNGAYGIVADAFNPANGKAWGMYLDNEPGLSGVVADHIEFLRCGHVQILGLLAGEHTVVDLNALTFRNQRKLQGEFVSPALSFDGYLDASVEVQPSKVAKRITNLVSTSKIGLRFVTGFTLDNFVLGAEGAGNARTGGNAGNAATHNNVFMYNTSGSSTNLLADLTDTSYLYMEVDNPHGWATPELRGDATLRNFWFESNYPNQSDAGDAVLTDGPQRFVANHGGALPTLTLEHSGSIGDSSDKPLHPVLFSFNNSEGIRLIARNNVARVNRKGRAIAINENGVTPSGAGISLLNSLFFADELGSAHVIGNASLSAAPQRNTFSEVDFNLYHNLAGLRAAQPPAEIKKVHDVPFTVPIDRNSVVLPPRLRDPQRNLAKWDASLGGPGTAANAIAELFKRNDDSGFNPAYDVVGLTNYVAEGFKTDQPRARGNDGRPMGPR